MSVPQEFPEGLRTLVPEAHTLFIWIPWAVLLNLDMSLGTGTTFWSHARQQGLSLRTRVGRENLGSKRPHRHWETWPGPYEGLN